MSLDFQQVHEQVRQLGENAPLREQKLREQRALARDLFRQYASEIDQLRRKVERVAQEFDETLRCARPVDEPLDAHRPCPPLPAEATILAADGSQINPDRHAAVEYCLINVGAIRMYLRAAEPPVTAIRSSLLYDEALYTATGFITDNLVALRRDLRERQELVELAAHALPPVITFTDGPMELWGGKDEGGAAEFQKSLKEYRAALSRLQELGATTAGYVDKPGADLVVRLLEVAMTEEQDLPDIRRLHRLRGVTDADLYWDVLEPGARSAVFALQSGLEDRYPGALALHFFYLNVGLEGRFWLARVEVPAWVAQDCQRLDDLQAVLVHQCRMLGGRSYPYLLHRAHETAVVTHEEQEQLTQMIMLELRRRGVPVGELSHKQALKDQRGRTRR